MSRRVTGWVLLAMAAVGASAVAALGLRDGAVDAWLVVIAGLALLAALTTVLLDRRALAMRDGPRRGDGGRPGRQRALAQRPVDG